jgi:BirA family transcriptional regulator, biotin operon repressor / biotin---[acetyl-CoA-carboxylase] ligase
MQSFDLSRLRRGLKPFRLHWFPRLRSTNDHAAVLRRRGELFAPAAVLTGRQMAGRGRGQNVWWSGPGCLTVTFALPIDEQILPHQFPLIAGLAVRSAAAELAGDDRILLKWPNDLLHDEKKLGGLLCERVLKADLVGIGLNLNADLRTAPTAIRRRMTTLAAIAGRAIDPTDALLRIAERLRETMLRGANRPFAALLAEYDAHHALVGRQVSVLDGPDAQIVSGRCKGLDSVGRLLLTDGKTVHRVISGQVILRP